MLIWVSALHCEAKPVIDFYRLKKSHEDNAFDLYRGDGMACIISGTGKIASAAACAWIAARYQDEPSIAWINLGIAGAAQHDIGRIFSLHQVIDADDGHRYYPAAACGYELEGSACMTLSQPGEDYREEYLFDMEASGFMYASLRFSSAELIKSLKIVSDNRNEKVGMNRQRVSDLVQQNIDSIDRQASALIGLNDEVAGLSPELEYWQQLTAITHFSQTQKNRLRVLWRYLMNRDYDAATLLLQLQGQKAGAIIKNLEHRSYQNSAGL
jgi:adenosylhomocysteine nucleosidase